MAEFVVLLDEPSYRTEQIFSWLHKGVESFGSMSNLSKVLRSKLDNAAYISVLKTIKKLVSEHDGTIKYLFELEDGEKIESVLMEYNHGRTICISTQAGCRMGCVFCVSALGGRKRNLTPSEMLNQVLAAENVSNIVLMGIGEPLDNYDNTIDFLKLINHPAGKNIGYRHISLSTCGIVDKIYELAELRLGLTLSVSLHAPTDELRNTLMPVNKKWNIRSLMEACVYYYSITGRRISFEYAMINGINDSEEQAWELANLLKNLDCHLNLIPANPGRGVKSSNQNAINQFKSVLEKNKINTTVRRKLGSDIDASCGQLRGENFGGNHIC